MNRVTAGQNDRIAPVRLIEANMHSRQEKGEYSLYRRIFIGLVNTGALLRQGGTPHPVGCG